MKKFLIAATLLLIVGVATAFTIGNKKTSHPKPAQTQEWFIFNGVAGEENMPSKYSLVSSNPECPNTGNKRCAVLAYRQSGSNPVIPDLSASYTSYVKP